MKKSEVLKNRKAWIERLKDPNSKKAIGRLENLETGGMCCIGHGCFVLGIKRTIGDEIDSVDTGYALYDGCAHSAPQSFIDKVGLRERGGFGLKLDKNPKIGSLIELNDLTPSTSQEIGEILESVIEGGDGSPFRSLEEYEDV